MKKKYANKVMVEQSPTEDKTHQKNFAGDTFTVIFNPMFSSVLAKVEFIN